ncbi:MAG TPA: hypothetical protein ENF73_01080, partial [Proteobacteria bacterium]|nr:hypothetical protein [Pseudomonadota bacterium]
MRARCVFAFALLASVAVAVCCCTGDRGGESSRDVECRADVQAADGRFTVSFDEPCGIELKGGDIRVGVQSGGSVRWKAGSEYPIIDVESKAGRTVVSYGGLPDFPALKLVMTPDDNAVLVEAELCNPHPFEIEVYGLEVPAFARELGGSTNLGSEVIVLQNGYDSWSFSWTLVKRFGDPLLPRCNGTVCAGGNNNGADATSGISFWNATIAPKPGGPGLTAGAVSAKRLKTIVAVEHRAYSGPDIRVVLGATGDIVRLDPNECYGVDPVALVASRDPLLSALEYADMVAERNPPPTIPPKFASPSGWSSWYCLFSRVTEQDILDHTRILAREGFRDAGYGIVQIDDGYEVAVGDWRTNEKFPRGLKPLADDIKSYGLVPGIWVAPFMFDADVELVQRHPDWFVRDSASGGLYTYDDP